MAKLEPYLYFDGNCEEAIALYKKIFDIKQEIYMSRFKDVPAGEEKDAMPKGKDLDEKIMHANLPIGGVQLMMSDNPIQKAVPGNMVSLTYSTTDLEEAQRIWDAFIEAGSKEQMTLGKTFFAELYGMLIDPFGISWQFMGGDEEQMGQDT